MRWTFLHFVLLLGCNPSESHPYKFDLPSHFPPPVVPAENPMTAEKVELGRYLFYERRLSTNQAYACASCHHQRDAFSDGNVTPVGTTGQPVVRNSMSLANVGYEALYMWANPLLSTLEEQALVPMFSDAPIEMGTGINPDAILARLSSDPTYVRLFKAAYPNDVDLFSMANVVKAIASFERTLISGGSPYDRYQAGDPSAMSASAQNGLALFNTEKYDCYHCHAGTTFTTSFYSTNSPGPPPRDFRNDGLYNIDGMGGYPPNNTGLFEFTAFSNDIGKFKIPTLRNTLITGPYFHDGSAATLDDVMQNYAQGGRLITSGPYAGDGNQSPHRDPLVKKFDMPASEEADMIAFLTSMTDTQFISDPRFSNPNCTNVVPAACPSLAPSYTNDVAPIMNESCGCHSPGGFAEPRPLNDYPSVQKLLHPLLNQIGDCLMPPADHQQLTDEQRALLLAWVVCGGPNN